MPLSGKGRHGWCVRGVSNRSWIQRTAGNFHQYRCRVWSVEVRVFCKVMISHRPSQSKVALCVIEPFLPKYLPTQGDLRSL